MAKKADENSKKEKKQAKTKEEDDFQYIVRIANTDIDGNKKLIHGLSSVKGIGRHLSTFVIQKTGLDRNTKMGHLKEDQIETIKNAISSIQEEAPTWMLNHRKNYETGEDIHIIGPQIDLQLRDEINIMKKIRSYKGIRHERGLTVRGQRTRANSRKGLTLGVSKSRGR
jgi:small subunit ribosomal protein S13